MKEHFELLGHEVRDVVTGYAGVVESICFDLYGCIQAVVRPGVDKKKPSEVAEGRYFDAKRLVKVSRKPVMPQPTFETVPGGSEKRPLAQRTMR